MNTNDILASLFYAFIATCILCLIILANATIRRMLHNRHLDKMREESKLKPTSRDYLAPMKLKGNKPR